MDLKIRFHQNRVRREYIEEMSFNPKYGQYEFLVLPMEMFNLSSSLLSLMSSSLYDFIDDFVVFYMSNLLMHS